MTRARWPLWAAAGAASAVGIAVVVWLLAAGGNEAGPVPKRATATGVSLPRLRAIAGSIAHPVYWVGPERGRTYELTRTGDGRIYIRYLPRGTSVGSARGDFLTVGTYPQANAFATLRAAARAQGAPTIPLSGGGVAFQDRSRPTSVYAAYPGLDYQVEVFEPSGGEALRLVRTGRLRALIRPASSAASPSELRTLAASLGHPIYWAGRRPSTTYELTRTRDGRVYIRYLPRGVRVGNAGNRYDTIGTYPQPGALATLRSTAAKLRVTTIRLPNGGLAYIDRDRPTSAYIAYPGSDLQIEVYTPDPRRTERMVTSREIRPVG